MLDCFLHVLPLFPAVVVSHFHTRLTLSYATQDEWWRPISSKIRACQGETPPSPSTTTTTTTPTSQLWEDRGTSGLLSQQHLSSYYSLEDIRRLALTLTHPPLDRDPDTHTHTLTRTRTRTHKHTPRNTHAHTTTHNPFVRSHRVTSRFKSQMINASHHVIVCLCVLLMSLALGRSGRAQRSPPLGI